MGIVDTNSNKSNISLRDIWKLSIFLYVVCYTAFASKSYLMMLSVVTLYFFFGVSLVCIFAQKEIKLNFFIITGVVFLAVLFLGYFYSESVHALEYIYNYFVLLCLIVCILNFVRDKNDILFIISALMIGGFIQNLYIVSIYGGDFIDILNDLSIGDDSNRVGRVAGNVNDVGLKSCYSAIIALYFVMNEKISKYRKTLYIIICLTCVFFSIITASKKVLILLIIGVLFLFFQKRDQKKNVLLFFKRLIVAVTIASILLYLIMNLDYFTYMRVRFEQFFDLLINGGGNTSDNKRVMFITQGLEVFLQHPIFGDGTACSYNYFGTYSHSNFVEILMCNGIVGFIAFYFCYPFVIYKGLKLIGKNRQRDDADLDLTPLCLFFFISIMILSVALIYYTFVYYQLLLALSTTYILEMKHD